MNALTKIVLILGGGYLLYRYFEGQQAAAAPATAATAAPAAPAPAPAASLDVTRNLLQQWANGVPEYQAAKTLNAFQWLWGYNHVRGTNLMDTGYADGSIQLTIDEFLANAQAKNIGLQGIAGVLRRAWGY